MTDLPAKNTITNVVDQTAAQNYFEQMRDVVAELFGGSAESELTIAAGSVTPTVGVHSIDTEGDASADDLDTMAQTNHPDGRFLLIRSVDPSRVVTVKHSSGGTGEIFLSDDLDFALDQPDKWLLLKRTGTQWEEVTRSFGTDAAAARSFIGAMGLSGGTFTGTLIQKHGTDAASASNLVLGDGNIFDVTGTTAITTIATKGVGTIVVLQFDASLTLTHHASNLVLPGGANIVTAAGDIALFEEYAAGLWRCIAYTKADGTAVTITFASQAEAEAGAENTKSMTALRTKQAIDALVDPGGRVLLGTATASSDSSIDIVSLITSTYDIYELIFYDLRPNTNNVNLWLRFSDDNGATFNSSALYDYKAGVDGESASSQSQILLSNSTSQIDDDSNDKVFGFIKLMNPLNVSGNKARVFYEIGYDTPSHKYIVGTGYINFSSFAVDAIQILMSTGNIKSGEFLFYGLKK